MRLFSDHTKPRKKCERSLRIESIIPRFALDDRSLGEKSTRLGRKRNMDFRKAILQREYNMRTLTGWSLLFGKMVQLKSIDRAE